MDLELFPPKSRSAAAHWLLALHQSIAGPTRTPKELWTVRANRILYIMFASNMKWDDDLTLQCAPPQHCQLQLAIYAKHLATGSTLLC
jgi:hypothetical protein